MRLFFPHEPIFLENAMRRLFLILISFLLTAGPAFADDPEKQIYSPGSTYKNETADTIRQLQKQSLQDKGFIKPQIIQVSLVRHDYMEDDQFGILMAVPDVVSGCWEVTPLEYESTFIDPYYFEVRVKHFQRRKIEIADVQTACPVENKMSTALIVLSRSDIEKRQTKQIRFSNGTLTDYYDIMFTENGLTLKPQSMVIFKAQGLTGPLMDHIEIGFNAGGKIALHVPMARQSDDIRGPLERFARTHALIPDHDSPISYDPGGGAVLFFHDDSGGTLNRIGEDGYTELGTVEIGRPYDGPDGRILTPVPLKVYVTRPGTQL